MRATTRRYLGQALLSVGLVLIVLVAIGAFGLSYSVRAAAHTETAAAAPQVILPERPAAQGGCSGPPLVDGLFYGIGADGCRDADRYRYLAESPGESVLYYYIDGNYLYGALVIDYNYNDNVFGDVNNSSGVAPNDSAYAKSAGWEGKSNSHTFKALYNSDHSVWSLFCGGNSWAWQQDYLWDTDGDTNVNEADWRSDPYGQDGSTPPAGVFITSASSLQWNMNFYATHPITGWNVTIGGSRTNFDDFKSYAAGGQLDNNVTDAADGWSSSPWAVSAADGHTIWEWHLVYEAKLDISQCGGNPFTLWPVTGHNSPPKAGNINETLVYEWGDLPDTGPGVGPGNYRTLRSDDGPRHVASNKMYLGNVLDPDGDGQPTVDALGDDNNPVGLADDEDGVWVSDLAAIQPGQPVSIRVMATNWLSPTAYLYGFIDYDGDGDFNDANEIAWTTVTTGTIERVYTLTFGTAPASLASTIYSRFRIGGIQSQVSVPYGLAWGGEVEDYVNHPTWALVENVSAYQDRGQVVVEWTTAAEIGTMGFNILRQDPRSGQFVPLNEDLLLALLQGRQGGTYRFVDEGAVPGKSYTYKIVEVGVDGSQTEHGPFTVKAAGNGPVMKDRFLAEPRQASAEQLARVEARAAELARTPEASAQAASTYAKIAIGQSGLYKVEASQVAGILGRSVNAVKSLIKTGGLKLTNLGQTVAYTPAPDNSALYFYGQAVDSPYTEQNIYWLSAGSGALMKASSGKAPQPAAGALTFVDTSHSEQDVQLLYGLTVDPASDYWAWKLLAAPWINTESFSVSSPGAAGSGTAILRVQLFGGSDQVPGLDHHTRVTVNGHFVGEAWWDGTSTHQFSVEFDASWLNSGANTVEVTEVADAGVPSSIVYVDSFDLTYPRLYQAVNNSLLLRGDANPVVTVGAYTSNDVLVLDLAVPDRPKLVGAVTMSGSAGNYAVSFKPTAATNYLAVERGAALAPIKIWADKASSLTAKSNRADFVVIAPAEFAEAAQALATYRQSQGLKTLVADVEDIYDEFNYGLTSPLAIKSFLSNAYSTWKVKPRYVVLAGEGSFDYRDKSGYHDSVVPTLVVLTPHGLEVSDNALADVAGDDGLPEMAIGRLPVLTSLELSTMVTKIKGYESATGPWASRVLMVADNPDLAGNFHLDSDEISGLLPSTLTPIKLYQGSALHPASNARVVQEINSGALVLNYIGHGAWDALAGEGLLTSGNVPSLNNGYALPVMSAMTCLVGDYGMPGMDSLSERLVLKGGGGIIASWAPTGLSVNPLAVSLDRGFFKAWFQDGKKVLGDAIRSAQSDYLASGGARYTLEIYNLLGDPALRVK